MGFLLPCIFLLLAYFSYKTLLKNKNCNKIHRGIWITGSFIIQIIWCYLVIFDYQLFSSDLEKIHPEYYGKKCGVIKKHIEGFESTSDKKSIEYKEYLVIKYDGGISERVAVSRNTYDNSSDNYRICFRQSTDKYDTVITISFLLGVLLVIGIIMQIIQINDTYYEQF